MGLEDLVVEVGCTCIVFETNEGVKPNGKRNYHSEHRIFKQPSCQSQHRYQKQYSRYKKNREKDSHKKISKGRPSGSRRTLFLFLEILFPRIVVIIGVVLLLLPHTETFYLNLLQN